MTLKKLSNFLLVFTLLTVWVFSDWIRILNFPPEIQKAHAAVPAIKVEHVDFDIGVSGTIIPISDVGSLDNAFFRNNTARRTSAGPTGSAANTNWNVFSAGAQLTDATTLTGYRAGAESTPVKMRGEVLRYVGPAGDDDEFIVRWRGKVTIPSGSKSSSQAISGISNRNKVVPFVQGVVADLASTADGNRVVSHAHIDSSDNLIVERGETGTEVDVYVAVVEFVGPNWSVGHALLESPATGANNITLRQNSDGTGDVFDTIDWSTAFIEASMSASTGNDQALEDTWFTIEPRSGVTTDVTVTFDSTAGLTGAEVFVHVLQHDDIAVTRYAKTVSIPVSADNTVSGLTNLDESAIEWYVFTDGTGDAYARGAVTAYLTSTTNISEWVHRTGNNGTYRYGVIDFSGVTVGVPINVALYDSDSVNQIAFNNIRQNNTTPIIRASAEHTGNFNRFQVEFNTASDFSGTAYTETFSGTYVPSTAYNLQTTTSLSLPSTDGVTYYVRVRASDNGGTSYSFWSSSMWTYTYKNTGDSEWFQTTDEQFDTGTLVSTQTNGLGSVELGGTEAIVVYLTSGTTWSVPNDWNNSDNSIEVIGAGGNGGIAVENVSSGAGGGGGEYRRAENVALTANSTIDINIPSGGDGSAADGAWVKDGVGGSIVVEAKNGGNASGITAGAGGTGGIGAAANFDGGSGAAGITNTTNSTASGGGGGGSAGPSGAGKNGGLGGSPTTLTQGGGGGGGSNGGVSTDGAANSGSDGGTGGAGYDGTGGGAGGTNNGNNAQPGTNGGGGGGAGNATGGTPAPGADGGVESLWDTNVGPSGGGGGGGAASGTAGTADRDGGNGGTYGGGAGGCGFSGVLNAGECDGSATGGQGIIVISYTPPALSATIMSPEINFDSVPGKDSWGEVAFSTTETNGDVKLSVYYTALDTCDTIIPNAALPGNESGFDVSASPIDISGLNTIAYSGICLQATLIDSAGTPFLNDWKVTWSGAITFEQEAYRWFENTDSTDVGSALAAQNTGATLSLSGAAFRLRKLLHVNSAPLELSGESFKLQFATMSGTCDVEFSGETYADVTDSTAIAYNNNSTPIDGASLTANANDPTVGNTIVNQTYEELNNFTNTVAVIPADQDGKWDFSLIDNSASPNTTYCFRVVKSDGSLLDSYTVIPEIVTAPGVLTFSISNNAVGFGTLSPAAARFATGEATFLATGGTVTESGGYRIHTFTTDGTFDVSLGSGDIEVLVVGGGGGGGTNVAFSNAGAGGGGGGGVVHEETFSVNEMDSISVVVGAGGSPGPLGNNPGGNGSNSSFGTIVALGGGGGVGDNGSGNSGGSGGGSRGGVGGAATQPGSVSGGFGNRGGNSGGSPAGAAATGGGGAGEAAEDLAGIAGEKGGDGGNGLQFNISGSPTYYGGGGGGGAAQTNGPVGQGGLGGGGSGANDTTNSVDGLVNTGGGGGGGNNNIQGAGGGSGIVIVRYPLVSGGGANGSGVEVEAHTLSASTNYGGGYSIVVRGATLTNNYGDTVEAIGNVSEASSVGTEQFGLRLNAVGGSGVVSSPYGTTGEFAYGATESVSDEIASSPGPSAETIYSVRYMGNVAPTTPAGSYSTNLTYFITSNF